MGKLQYLNPSPIGFQLSPGDPKALPIHQVLNMFFGPCHNVCTQNILEGRGPGLHARTTFISVEQKPYSAFILAWWPSVCLNFWPLFVKLSPTILWKKLISSSIVPPGPSCQTDSPVNWVFCLMALPPFHHNGVVHHLRCHSCWRPLVLLELDLFLWTRPRDTWSVGFVTIGLTDSESATPRFPVDNCTVRLILITAPSHSAANFSSAAEGHPQRRPTKAHCLQKSRDVILRLQSQTHFWLQDPAHGNPEGDWPTTRTIVQLMKTQLSLPSRIIVSLKNLQTNLHPIHKAEVDRSQ